MEPSLSVQMIVKRFERLTLIATPSPSSQRGRELVRPHSHRNSRWLSMPGDPWQVGWRHRGPEVVEGYQIADEDVAQVLLEADLVIVTAELKGALEGLSLNQAQFDALVSFVFDRGILFFQDSDLLRTLQRADLKAASFEFDRIRNIGNELMFGGDFILRRKIERRLFDGIGLSLR